MFENGISRTGSIKGMTQEIHVTVAKVKCAV